MARTRTTKSTGFSTAEKDSPETPMSEEVSVLSENSTAAETSEANPVSDPKAPVNIELTVSEEPQAPAPAAAPEKIQTDVRERLAKKSVGDNIFAPTTPAALEKAAEEVAKEQGFEFNRGTSIGARLIARAQKRA